MSNLNVALRDVRGGRRLGLDGDLDRIVQVLLRDPANRAGHRCREQSDLLVAGGVAEDALDVLLEAHLEHLVGLVQNEVLEIGQIQGALFEMVDDTTRRTDDDVRTAAQSGQLDAVALATVDRQDVESGGDVRGVLAEGSAT